MEEECVVPKTVARGRPSRAMLAERARLAQQAKLKAPSGSDGDCLEEHAHLCVTDTLSAAQAVVNRAAAFINEKK